MSRCFGGIIFLNNPVRPNRRHELIFADNFATSLHQIRQGVKRLWHQRHALTATRQQQAFRRIDIEIAEGKQADLRLVDISAHKFS